MSAQITWTGASTLLEFLVFTDRIVISQDGTVLGSAAVSRSFVNRMDPETVEFGYGVFGPFKGRLLRSETSGF